MKNKQSYEIANIFSQHLDGYLSKYGSLPKHYYDVVNAIMHCQTEQLGGHIYKCDSCSKEISLYNSCRNRHCPKCQAKARAVWVDKKMEDALPVPYFHVVFTLPHQLNPIVLRNKKESYSILFKAVSETLIELGKDKKRMNGQIGFIASLHTWGQTLTEHPHIHCVIPAGALNKKESEWNDCKKDFLFPVAVMQKLFMGKFMAYFSTSIENGAINPMFTSTPEYPSFYDLVKKLYSLKWVVYVEKPQGKVENLIKYQARYINRIAISNKRIISFEKGMVSFSYKDYSDNNTNKVMTISAVEFIRRFLLHILPEKFMRIRQYGFLSNASKKKSLSIIRSFITGKESSKPKGKETPELDGKEKKGNEIKCTCCKNGILIKGRKILPVRKVYRKVVND